MSRTRTCTRLLAVALVAVSVTACVSFSYFTGFLLRAAQDDAYVPGLLAASATAPNRYMVGYQNPNTGRQELRLHEGSGLLGTFDARQFGFPADPFLALAADPRDGDVFYTVKVDDIEPALVTLAYDGATLGLRAATPARGSFEGVDGLWYASTRICDMDVDAGGRVYMTAVFLEARGNNPIRYTGRRRVEVFELVRGVNGGVAASGRAHALISHTDTCARVAVDHTYGTIYAATEGGRSVGAFARTADGALVRDPERGFALDLDEALIDLAAHGGVVGRAGRRPTGNTLRVTTPGHAGGDTLTAATNLKAVAPFRSRIAPLDACDRDLGGNLLELGSRTVLRREGLRLVSWRSQVNLHNVCARAQ